MDLGSAHSFASPSVLCRSVDVGSDAPDQAHLSRTEQSVIVHALLSTMKILNSIFCEQTMLLGWNKQIRGEKKKKERKVDLSFDIQSTEQSACLNKHFL